MPAVITAAEVGEAAVTQAVEAAEAVVLLFL